MPSHYLNQSWNIVNWNLRNKLEWNFQQNSYIFIQENAFENIVCEMVATLSEPQRGHISFPYELMSELWNVCCEYFGGKKLPNYVRVFQRKKKKKISISLWAWSLAQWLWWDLHRWSSTAPLTSPQINQAISPDCLGLFHSLRAQPQQQAGNFACLPLGLFKGLLSTLEND